VSKTADAKARIFVERYEILELLGKGGMSAVYQARHLLMKKDVAIKMMHKHTDSDTVSVRRFQQETEATSKMSHRTAI
jgi:serine/threonine-protein kinase